MEKGTPNSFIAQSFALYFRPYNFGFWGPGLDATVGTGRSGVSIRLPSPKTHYACLICTPGIVDAYSEVVTKANSLLCVAMLRDIKLCLFDCNAMDSGSAWGVLVQHSDCA
ncbi:hypothetical protein PCH_Pc12g07020 [Penicillium rubens Wisconsin 54-1255]|uniref:Uncharacterized protein n=1 Tax=Penicillium rubens (strain ATCC 28089 / DSM 1075 / NRRL 1951 / Wisconsin 54-1255) TaxID=500485 RepID=B6H0Y0_PENRW|nr:hypothetical protein PCH_Pc12g07020 [Penicillium rubens Wisconsin 54-1255]